MFSHKNIRLSPRNYQGRQFYFLTFCCFNRRRIFSGASLCAWLIDLLGSESASRAFAIHAYCVMPDHLHFLAEGLTPTSDLANLAKTLKIKTSRFYQKQASQPLWQKKYFDHILRPHEQVERVA
jgi:putative transposase